MWVCSWWANPAGVISFLDAGKIIYRKSGVVMFHASMEVLGGSILSEINQQEVATVCELSEQEVGEVSGGS